jgi:hypothetical protein
MSNLNQEEINEIEELFESTRRGTHDYSEQQKEKLKKFCENQRYICDDNNRNNNNGCSFNGFDIKQKERAIRRFYYQIPDNRELIKELEEEIKKLSEEEQKLYDSEDFKKYYPAGNIGNPPNHCVEYFDVAKNYIQYLELVCGGIRTNTESMRVFINYLKERV